MASRCAGEVHELASDAFYARAQIDLSARKQIEREHTELSESTDGRGAVSSVPTPRGSSSGSSFSGDARHIKVVFLDVDGPLLPWTKGTAHRWKSTDSVSDEPYRDNIGALLRIVDAAGGPSVVKIVISSNWRTDDEKYPWLETQLALVGLDVIGHTDVVNVHPKKCENPLLARNLEIFRALTSRQFGAGGPQRRLDDSLTFAPFAFPENWEITDWIAIDDLPLDAAPRSSLDKISLVSYFMSVPGDSFVGNGWMAISRRFVQDVHTWMQDFANFHFVLVDSERGIGGTESAETLAIQLLTRNSD